MTSTCQPRALRRGDAGMAGDAVVDRDQQVRLQRGEIVDQRRRQAVAVHRCGWAPRATRAARRACAARARRPRRRWRRRNRNRRRRRCGGRAAIASASNAVAASRPPSVSGGSRCASRGCACSRLGAPRAACRRRSSGGTCVRPVADGAGVAAPDACAGASCVRALAQRLAPEAPALASARSRSRAPSAKSSDSCCSVPSLHRVERRREPVASTDSARSRSRAGRPGHRCRGSAIAQCADCAIARGLRQRTQQASIVRLHVGMSRSARDPATRRRPRTTAN